jgi:hypothetical protein
MTEGSIETLATVYSVHPGPTARFDAASAS